MAGMRKAGEVEKSHVQISSNPHQEILQKLMTRPFLKHKVLTSSSVKSFIYDIFEDGLNEDMVIFEPNFVKKYPGFSTEYVDHHFNYNKESTLFKEGGDFLSTYDKIVQPKRWQRSYKDVGRYYTQQTQSTVFQNKFHQGSIFQNKSTKTPYEVFKCNPKDNTYENNVIMKAIKAKIRQSIAKMQENYVQLKF